MTDCKVKRPKLVLSVPLVTLMSAELIQILWASASLFTKEEIGKDYFLRFFHSKIFLFVLGAQLSGRKTKYILIFSDDLRLEFCLDLNSNFVTLRKFVKIVPCASFSSCANEGNNTYLPELL